MWKLTTILASTSIRRSGSTLLERMDNNTCEE